MMLWESFDQNEIYILLLFSVALGAFLLFKKILPRYITILFLTWGFASSLLFDFTIGGGFHDYYKVNDSNHYELFDLITYFSFSFFGYFFVYFYEKFAIQKVTFIPYILGWTVIGLTMEKLSTIMGVIHYQDGYSIQFSVVVFLIVQTTTALYYELVKRNSISPEGN
ncbi:hypothetical protein LS684_04770 [Cytobacillus spongiae]|jgi:hypothetical protein|uniref:hypothetical protein n=1 Tax=Cytobacillus spongiae TaxID=2901381 RepID=UPI001F1BB672|nr:hypothetical protein [Cytobacillus spongiae]UII56784.1 hypothetical protein LS684_04770 [Cytobacillus spongiae]